MSGAVFFQNTGILDWKYLKKAGYCSLSSKTLAVLLRKKVIQG